MIEVVFDNGHKACMHMAHKLNPKLISNRVVSIGFAMDIGDISDGTDLYRKEIFDLLWGRFHFSDDEKAEFYHEQKEDFNTLINAAKQHERIRIWVSNIPYILCGFYYVCWLLKNDHCPIDIVQLPDFIQLNDMMISYDSLQSVIPENIIKLVPYTTELNVACKDMYAKKWEMLMYENMPLRVYMNGKLLSAPIDFYDIMIEHHMPKDEFYMAKFIGKLLDEDLPGICDSFIALRIEQMIRDNKLMIVNMSEDLKPYNLILKKL